MSELKEIRNSLEKLKADSGRVYSAVSDLLARLDEQPVEPHVYGQIRFRVDKALAAEKEPDVYEQIQQRYGSPFADLHPPDGYFFLMAGPKEQLPIFRRADPGEWWLGVDDIAFAGPTTLPFLILRPAKRIPAHNEDLRGEWVLTESGSITHYRFVDVGKTRYRREGGPK